jgi:hypothetical protein
VFKKSKINPHNKLIYIKMDKASIKDLTKVEYVEEKNNYLDNFGNEYSTFDEVMDVFPEVFNKNLREHINCFINYHGKELVFNQDSNGQYTYHLTNKKMMEFFNNIRV